MPKVADGIALSFYPARLRQDEVQLVEQVIAAKTARLSPQLAGWLLAVADAEKRRRASDDAIDVDLPRLNCIGWSDAELASAVQAAYCGLSVTYDMPGARDLLHNAVMVLLGWLVARLEKRENNV